MWIMATFIWLNILLADKGIVWSIVENSWSSRGEITVVFFSGAQESLQMTSTVVLHVCFRVFLTYITLLISMKQYEIHLREQVSNFHCIAAGNKMGCTDTKIAWWKMDDIKILYSAFLSEYLENKTLKKKWNWILISKCYSKQRK